MKRMKVKKILAAVLALMMIASLAACGKKADDNNNGDNNTDNSLQRVLDAGKLTIGVGGGVDVALTGKVQRVVPLIAALRQLAEVSIHRQNAVAPCPPAVPVAVAQPHQTDAAGEEGEPIGHGIAVGAHDVGIQTDFGVLRVYIHTECAECCG